MFHRTPKVSAKFDNEVAIALSRVLARDASDDHRETVIWALGALIEKDPSLGASIAMALHRRRKRGFPVAA